MAVQFLPAVTAALEGAGGAGALLEAAAASNPITTAAAAGFGAGLAGYGPISYYYNKQNEEAVNLRLLDLEVQRAREAELNNYESLSPLMKLLTPAPSQYGSVPLEALGYTQTAGGQVVPMSAWDKFTYDTYAPFGGTNYALGLVDVKLNRLGMDPSSDLVLMYGTSPYTPSGYVHGYQNIVNYLMENPYSSSNANYRYDIPRTLPEAVVVGQAAPAAPATPATPAAPADNGATSEGEDSEAAAGNPPQGTAEGPTLAPGQTLGASLGQQGTALAEGSRKLTWGERFTGRTKGLQTTDSSPQNNGPQNNGSGKWDTTVKWAKRAGKVGLGFGIGLGGLMGWHKATEAVDEYLQATDPEYALDNPYYVSQNYSPIGWFGRMKVLRDKNMKPYWERQQQIRDSLEALRNPQKVIENLDHNYNPNEAAPAENNGGNSTSGGNSTNTSSNVSDMLGTEAPRKNASGAVENEEAELDITEVPSFN